MATCKECLHFEVCDGGSSIDEFMEQGTYTDGVENDCETFKDRNCIVELLCNVGDTVWLLDGKFAFKSKVDEIRILSGNRISYHCKNAYDWFETSDFGKTVFLSAEDAEQMIGGNY